MNTSSFQIDRLSFQLGMINCFVEMVAAGVKRLALSPPLLPEDFERIKLASDRLVHTFGINSYTEKSLLITDLQSEEFTLGKWSVLYYKTDDVLQSYLELKAMKQRLLEENRYSADRRQYISTKFMELLSYSQEVIDEKLAGKGEDPAMLIDL